VVKLVWIKEAANEKVAFGTILLALVLVFPIPTMARLAFLYLHPSYLPHLQWW